MPEKATDLNQTLPGGHQSMLEGIFLAEYLICKGYLESDLEHLPTKIAQSLWMEGYRFVRLRLSDMEFVTRHPWKISLTISPN